MGFEGLIGNEKIKKLLTQTVQENKVLHSYLWMGEEGIGKSLFAKEFAKMILCMQTETKADEQCKACVEFEHSNHPDYYEIVPQEGTIKIEKIRQMQEKIIEKPIISKRKVYVITDCHKMTKEAQNCLLKTLEEPPEYVTIILLTSNENSLLNTIKSRCMKLHFEPIPEDILKEYLQQNIGIQQIPPNMLDFAQGSIARAIQLQEQKDILEKIEAIFNKVESLSLVDVLANLDFLYKNKENSMQILDYINILFAKKGTSTYSTYIQEVEKTKNRIASNANFEMCIDQLIFNIWS